MAKTHTINISYSGGGTSSVSSQLSITGQSEFNSDTVCAGASTTTINPSLVMDPDARIQSYCLMVTGGNATFAFTASGGTHTTIGLVDSVPAIAWYDTVTDLTANVPTSADTYTLSVRNANAGTITFDGRMVLQ